MRRGFFAGGLVLAAIVFLALGGWQLQRLAWKLDLIEQVNARVHAEPRNLEAWSQVGPGDAYRRVRVRGVYLRGKEIFVQALTEQGAGWWVLTPLRTGQGVVLINRGFVPKDRRDDHEVAPPVHEVTVMGLIRMSEPGGGFLRANDPVAERWFSRDVAAIVKRRALPDAASFFIDADSGANPHDLPIGGLTVVSFSNPHLVYALTWFLLGGLCGWGVWLLFRRRDAGLGSPNS